MKSTLINSIFFLLLLHCFGCYAQEWEELKSPGYSLRYHSTDMICDDGMYLSLHNMSMGSGQMLLKYENGKWLSIGDPSVYNNIFLLAVKNGIPYVSASTSSTGLSIMKYTGGSLHHVATFTNALAQTNSMSFAIDNKDSMYLFFVRNGLIAPTDAMAFPMKYRDGKWIEISRIYSETYIFRSGMVLDHEGCPNIAYAKKQGGNYEITVQRYCSDSLEKTSSELAVPIFDGRSLAFSNTGIPHIVAGDGVYYFTNNEWHLLGTKGNFVGGGYFAGLQFDKNNVPYIGYVDRTDGDRVKVKKFNGSAWEVLGNLPATSGLRNMSFTIDKDGPMYVTCLYSAKSNPSTTDSCQVRVFRYGPASIVGGDSVCVRQSILLNNESGNGTWSSSNTNIAQVDASGNVSGVNIGSATISYTVSGNSSLHTIWVKKCPEDSDNIRVRSNVSEGIFYVTVPSAYPGTATIIITNTLGQTVAKTIADTNTETPLYVGSVPGVYIISVLAPQRKQHVKVAMW